MHMKSPYQTTLLPVKTLSCNTIAQMTQLYLAHYQGSSRDLFERDLQEKQEVLVLMHDDVLVGFTSFQTYELTWQQRPIRVGYSGDTIVAQAHWGLGLRAGLLVVVPPPAEAALPAERVETAIESALRQAEQAGVHGSALTPFLLARVSELTGGESLKTNLALLLRNAAVGVLAEEAVVEVRDVGGDEFPVAPTEGALVPQEDFGQLVERLRRVGPEGHEAPDAGKIFGKVDVSH